VIYKQTKNTLGVVGILAREDVKVLTVYVDLSVICVICVDCVICIGLEVWYYQTNIALAASSLAAKTTALAAQLATAVASSGAYGFNAGRELDIDALERQLQAQQTQ
jgi:hypothetical protein